MGPFLDPRPRPRRAYERLYARHAGDVYRYAVAVLQDEADAEDVTQATFRNVYRALERGERPARARSWVITIAHGVCRQRVRRTGRLEQEDEEEESLGGDEVRRALSRLPFDQRTALVLRELQGRPCAEIAEVLELPAGAVETLLFRARRALREELEASLSCHRAELAVSRDLDGRLSRAERRALRAHLRDCPGCAAFARRQRTHRVALGALGAVALPASLAAGGSGRR